MTLVGLSAVGLLLLGSGTAQADNIVNNLDNSIDVANEVLTVEAGRSAQVGFYVAITSGVNDPGCNIGVAGDGKTVTIALTGLPAGVTATPVTIDTCDSTATTTVREGLQLMTITTSTSTTIGNHPLASQNFIVSPSATANPIFSVLTAWFTIRVTPPSDTTPPLITPTVSGTLGTNGWYTSAVTVSWSVSDPESTTTVVSGCGTQSFVDETAATTSSCVASSAGGQSSGSTTFGIDLSGPTAVALAVTGTVGQDGWYVSDVDVTTSGTEDLSAPAECTAVQHLTDTVGQTVTGACTNQAGLSTAAAPVTVKIDTQAPTDITFVGGIADAGSYPFGAVPLEPTCTATDVTSGLASCVVTGYSTTPGSHTLTATATDRAGNSAVATLAYSVTGWTIRGFYAPIDMDTSTIVWNVAKGGSTVPLKFEVFAGATELTDTAVIVQPLSLTAVSCVTGGVDAPVEILATGATTLRYDATAGQFVYNWKTPVNPGGCYEVKVRTLDGSSVSAHVKLK